MTKYDPDYLPRAARPIEILRVVLRAKGILVDELSDEKLIKLSKAGVFLNIINEETECKCPCENCKKTASAAVAAAVAAAASAVSYDYSYTSSFTAAPAPPSSSSSPRRRILSRFRHLYYPRENDPLPPIVPQSHQVWGHRYFNYYP